MAKATTPGIFAASFRWELFPSFYEPFSECFLISTSFARKLFPIVVPPQNERFIVNGSHDADKLQDLLDGFIRKFVLCPECDNPETDLKVSSKKGTISQGCKACGFHGPLEVNHKVSRQAPILPLFNMCI